MANKETTRFALDKLKKSYHLTNDYKELDDKLSVWGKEGTRSHGKIKVIEEDYDSYFKKNEVKWNPKDRPRQGFDKVKEILKNKENPIYLELGAELGSSAKEILETFPTSTVIAIDYWQPTPIGAWPELTPIIEDPKYGPYSIFSNRLFEYKDRLIPIQEYTIKGLEIVKQYEINPDIIYIDASHWHAAVLEDIVKAYILFPNSILCGDDYTTNEGVKQAVTEFCDNNNLVHEVHCNQWIITGDKKVMAIELPKLKKVDLNKPKKKRILLLSDDMRLHSGVGTMSKELCLSTVHKYDWVQVGGAIKHPDGGKIFDMSAEISKETGVKDVYVKIYPTDGYGNPDMIRQIIQMEKPDMIMHFTDPRFWGWLYAMEHEIRQTMPLMYLNIWDDLPYPHWNENFYETCDLLMGISKQTVNINRNVCQRKPRTNIDLTYVPHGIDENKFYPIDINHTEFSKMYDFKTKLFNTEEHPEFVAFFNSRNIRRKGISSLIIGYKLFCDTLSKEESDKCMLLLHTDRVDNNGTDLPAVIRALAPDYNIKFTDRKFHHTELNYLYNIATVTCQPSSAEGFGLSVCESLMSGTPIMATCIGGLQDQMGFKKEDGSYLTVDDYTTDFPSNSNFKYANHGEWAFPLKANLSLAGSPPTPYIYDSCPSISDIKENFKTIHSLGLEECKRRGISGREYVRTPEIGMTSKMMAQNFKDSVENMLKHWKPRKRFSMIDSKELNIKYPAGIILE